MGKEDYSKKILNELSKKYNKEFEIVQMTYEVSGERKSFYRAVCKETGDDRTFVAYYYLGDSERLSSDKTTDTEANNRESFFVDEYVNLSLNRQYENYFTENYKEVLFAISDIEFYDHILSKDEMKKGLEYCISNEDYNTHSKIYLFINFVIYDSNACSGRRFC